MCRHLLQLLKILQRLSGSNQMNLAGLVNHHHIGPQVDELLPLAEVVGAHFVHQHVVAGREQGQEGVLNYTETKTVIIAL